MSAPRGNQFAKGSKTNGRPSSYRPQFAKQAKELCERGATNGELARFFYVAVSTIKLWGLQYEEFSAAVRLGKEIADERVEQALFDRAIGYDYDSGTGRNRTIRHMPPDVGAIKVWLYNRRPDRWRDKIEVTQTGTLSDLPSIEIKKRLVAKMIEWGLVPKENVPPELLPLPDGTVGEE